MFQCLLIYSFFSFLMCLWLGFTNVVCILFYSCFFLSLCACGSVLPMFVPLYFHFFFSFASLPWFCQCSMPLHYIFSFLCVFVTSMFYASLLILFFFSSVAQYFAIVLCLFFIVFSLSFVFVTRFCQCLFLLISFFLFFCVCD